MCWHKLIKNVQKSVLSFEKGGRIFQHFTLIEAFGTKSSNRIMILLVTGVDTGVKNIIWHVLSALERSRCSIVILLWTVNEMRCGRSNTDTERDTNHTIWLGSDRQETELVAKCAENLPNWKHGQNWAVKNLTCMLPAKKRSNDYTVKLFLSILPSRKAS